MKKNVIILSAFVLLAACASAGNEKVRTETMGSLATKVTKGVTTKEQIKSMYGEPLHVSLTDGGGEVWTYEYAHATTKPVTFVPLVGLFAGGKDIDKNEVVFIFNGSNIMENYTVHASQTEAYIGGGDVDTQ